MVLRGAYLGTDKTAKGEAAAIRDKCMVRLKRLLEKWIELHEKKFPGEVHSIPSPTRFGLHRFAKGGSVMTDGCNQARALQYEIEKEIEKAYIESIGQERWNAMSAEEKVEAVRVHIVNCWNHFRNTFLRHAEAKEKAYLKEMLEEELQQFSARERVTPDITALTRAVAKEFVWFGTGNNQYAKGHGNEFFAWAIEK